MDERFLHYIWKFQKLNGRLKTTDDQDLIVLNQGNHNHNSGPDFEEARVKIGELEWAGKIEIHVNSSDWYSHNHHLDKAYEGVILHVVWKYDKDVLLKNEPIPTLELSKLIDQDLYQQYKTFINEPQEIICQNQLPSISELTFTNQLDRMMVERLKQKSVEILDLVKSRNADWEEVTYISLAKNFGFSVNKEPFLALATSLPYKILAKSLGNRLCIEALIFGQAGFLEDIVDTYQEELKREYEFLKKKHELRDPLAREMWKSGRMRPSNFPSVRLAQFAGLIGKNEHLFSQLIEIEDPKDIVDQLEFQVSDYWIAHYDFGKEGKKKSRNVGRGTLDNLLINTLAPLFAAYSKYTGNQAYMDRAIKVLEMLPAEKNNITKKWVAVGKPPNSAFDSQSLIGLYKNYCSQKKCLDCSIGVEILEQ